MQQRRAYMLQAIGAVLVAALVASCGGASQGAGQGLVLASFRQANVDNIALNQILVFQFSEPVDPATIGPGSIQIRRGDEFGLTSAGSFHVDGATVEFWPALPSRCDRADAGFDADTQYRVQVMGAPEEYAVKNLHGQPLEATITSEFHTRTDADPAKFIDPSPGVHPTVLSSSPAQGAAAVSTGTLEARQRIAFTVSENLDPCSVGLQTVSVEIYEVGGTEAQSVLNPANGNLSGFVTGTDDVKDQLPDDPTSWGSDTGSPWPGGPQSLPVSVHLVQDYAKTQIVVSPLFGRDSDNPTGGGIFPDNVLIVVRLDSAIRDFSGLPLSPHVLAFTTENTTSALGDYVLEAEGETPFLLDGTTADVNTERAPGLIQGFLLFAGDGDNGPDPLIPSRPGTPGSGCKYDYQENDGNKDEFDATGSVTLNTGSTPNTCPNETDGSTAVVWEFAKFTIRGGATVRIIGVNPAILLVQGSVTIESGGRLLVRGDGQGGSPRSAGRTGYTWTSNSTTVTYGGDGVAGGGGGGDAVKFNTAEHGGDGFSAYGSATGLGVEGGEGAGLGGSNHLTVYPSSPGTAQGGGGGGHAVDGGTATNVLGSGHTNMGETRGQGGGTYPDGPNAYRMPTPSAGGGGGAGGNEEWDQSYKGVYSTGGGSGGAGGGFVDITSSGNITILGTIDAAGSPGGDGGSSSYYAGPGGGGGGAGGGVRLLTPRNILLGGTTVITTAGGNGGTSPNGSSGSGGPQNHGAPGGYGRIVLEDGDSVISGIQDALLIPAEGQNGFHRGQFDAGRFQGGGLTPQALTDLIFMGPIRPQYLDPEDADFIAGAPRNNIPGAGAVVIEIEAQGFSVLSDGTADPFSASGFQLVGRFTDTGIESAPAWTNVNGLVGLSGYEFLQLRFTFYLSSKAGPFDPGSFIDRWTIRFMSDN